jgi:hypothetical protein
MNLPEEIVIRLTRAEALVLFEWLAREDADGKTLPVEHLAEERVFWRIEGQLENALAEPLSPQYKELLDAARNEVVRSEE